jgi:two-component system CheB/CheR fusion protein
MTKNPTDQPESPAVGDAPDECDEPVESTSFPVVGVGASAGGLEALTQLLKALPADTGMAFVLVQHLAPTHASALAEILSRATKMPVMEVLDDLAVEPNHVYIIPPGRSMIIVRGALQLLPREGGMHRPVDQFFRALAEDRRHQSIGVVLSGTASDGTLGLEAIKGEGGITFAQDATAQHDGMPHSAIASGCVDFVLPPEGIAQEIVRIVQHPHAVPDSEAREAGDKRKLAQVVQLLHHATGVDFTYYKFNTLFRRVTRRMVFQKLDSLPDYVNFLRKTPGEVDALYQDILISVTRFFRDIESFEALKRKVFPRLLKDRSPHDPVRLWTLGCSTGQEAYSLAMVFAEAADAAGSAVPLQLFATDLNPAGIVTARAGVYTKDIAEDVSPERLRRFFTDVDGSYRISKSIRDVCVFSQHNVLTDPPFSRIDLISCRNLLIYLEPVMQQKLMPTLHYALKPAGCLWLGSSETISTYGDLFKADDAKHKIYSKKPGSAPSQGRFSLQHGRAPLSPITPVTGRRSDGADLHREADRVLSAKFAPPGVLVSADMDILQYRGDTGPYLAPVPGKASLSLPKMLREGLLVAVRAALVRAGKEQVPVREQGLRVKSDDGYREVGIEVIPIKGRGGQEGGFLVLFEDSSQASRATVAPDENVGEGAIGVHASPGSLDIDIARLQQELSATREYLQSLIEQQEAANEELQSANEEVQSANEELQSTNEELETSKEEIQSSNEELATVNDELNNRNTELNRVNDDLINLLGSVQMAIVMLGGDLRIRRFTPTAEKLLNLTPTDVGRSLADIKLNLVDLPDLVPLLTEVLDTVHPKECDVRDKEGRWYSLRLRPYRTLDNKIDGVVVMLVDMSDRKRAEVAVKTQNERLHLLWEAAAALLSTDDPDAMLRGLFNAIGSPLGLDTYFNYRVDDSGDALQLVSSAGIPQEAIHVFERLGFGEFIAGTVALNRQSVVATRIQQSDDPKARLVKSAGLRAYACNPLVSDQLLLGALAFGSHTRDEFEPDELAVLHTISHYVAVAYERMRLLNELRDSDRRKDEFLAMLSHELRNPLAPILSAVELLQLKPKDDDLRQKAVGIVDRQVSQLVHLIDDLLEVSRISTGRIHLQRQQLDLRAIIENSVETVRLTIEQRRHELAVHLPPSPIWIDGDLTRLEQVVVNLLNNAAKYTDDGGKISLSLEGEGKEAVLRVQDSGVGIAPDRMPHIFDLFAQGERSLARSQGGLGIGLSLVKRIVEMHSGNVTALSTVGQGSEFVVRLPLMQTAEPQPPSPRVAKAKPIRPLRVLVVDDSKDTATSMALLLGHSGHDVRTAPDGPSALKAALDFRPDVALMDVGLPGFDGFEVAKRMRQEPTLQKFVLVAVTGYGRESDRQRAQESGFDHFLVKPTDLKKVQEIFASVSERTTPSGESSSG